jgi:cytochrome c peroxidase
MVFKKALSALVLALPLVSALPSKRALNPQCDFLKPIAADIIENLFDNECGDTAHGALRISFHDAIGIDPKIGGGGADGSLFIFNSSELLDPANVGIDDIVDEIGPFFLKNAHVITPGDFIQLVGALSLTVCPGAPQVDFVIGRPPPVEAAPFGLVPQPVNTTDQILERFAAVNFQPEEIIALLSSHTVAGADDFAPPLQGVPFDSTPSVFDTNIFIDVLLEGALFPVGAQTIEPGIVGTSINGTIRLLSDFALARDSRTACFWQAFATDHQLMTEKFAAAFFKMGLLGQANNKNLIDCSGIIPKPPALNDVIEFPPQEFLRDIQQSCDQTAFPDLKTAPGPALTVAPIVQADAGGS